MRLGETQEHPVTTFASARFRILRTVEAVDGDGEYRIGIETERRHPMLEENRKLREENEALRDLLRSHGIDPGTALSEGGHGP